MAEKHKVQETKKLKLSKLKLPILGREHSVQVDSISDRGEYDSFTATIRINENDPDKRSVLVHEAIHAILYESGLCHVLERDNLEEAVVLAVENGLMRSGLIKDDRDLHELYEFEEPQPWNT